MRTLTLVQGSPEWHAHRRTTRNASDAPAMMGASPYVSRAQLVRQYATGIEQEIDEATQRRFDRGNEVEPNLRALAEKILGDDLYPVTGVTDDGYLGASFDGVTLAEDVIFEAKLYNAEKVACIQQNEIPPADLWQIVQQFAVCESAQRCLYLVGDGTEEGTFHLDIARWEIEERIPQLFTGWRQLDADVAIYKPEAAATPATIGRAPDQLPALRIELTGMVTESNLHEFKERAIAVFQGISTNLQTDQDFANAEQTVKWCGDIEDRLAAAKEHALSQTQSIDALFKAIDAISSEARAKRLELDKLVKARKEAIRGEIVAHGREAVRAHYETINASLVQHALGVPAALTADLAAAIKGKRTITSLHDAVDTVVVTYKIEASQSAERVRANIAILAEHSDHASLFADRVVLCATKAPEDLRNLVAARIAEHQQREAERLEQERERIRQEEAEKLRQQAAADSAHSIATSGGVSDSGGVPDRNGAGSDGGRSPGAHDAAGHAQGDGTLGNGGLAPAAAAINSDATIKLGDFNLLIAPLSVTSDGLAKLGCNPQPRPRTAKVYRIADLATVCEALQRIVANAPVRAQQDADQQQAA